MPFTPAHTAVVLPFIRMRNLSATGLIVGSVAPDFEYFFKMSVNSVHSHTLPGLIYFCLPVTFFLSLIFHYLVKENLLANSPVCIQQRFNDLRSLRFSDRLKQHPYAFIVSALLGSASHILWDSFTHGKGFFVQTLSFYEGSYIPWDGVNYPLFYALQHISTYVGCSVLILFMVFKKRDLSARVSTPRITYWLLLTGIASIAVILRFLIIPDDLEIGNFVVSVISGLCLGAIVCGTLPPMSTDNSLR